MRRILLLCLLSFGCMLSLQAQRQMETLDRGLVAIKTAKGVYVSWRIPGDEWYDVTYNLYRDGVKVNDVPLTVSNYTDAAGSATSTYSVRPVVRQVEQEGCPAASVWGQQYLQIAMSDLYSKNGNLMNNAYSINDACAADLDGDGEYELIVKRMNGDFTTANDTAYCLFQAYKMDGTLLWTIDMGPNLICAGHVETNCQAFDFDEDGKAEVVFRATDGTILPDGTVMGDKTVNYRQLYPGQTYQCYGDEWLVVLKGETGKLIDSKIFDTDTANGNNLARRSAAFWWEGNSKAYGHRANKFHFGAPYLDGRHPSIYVGRGCYTNIHMATYDLVNGKLQLRWRYYNDDPSSKYYGQGYHNYSIVDVDGDGCDEICHGNMVINNDGTELSSTGLGHGDAQHYGDLDPYRKGIEGFRCLEDNPGAVFVDAATNEILFRWIRGNDCGRCLAGNFTDAFPGAQLWTVDGHLWSASTSRAADQVVATSAPGVTMNNRIYWDGDILEESFDYGYRDANGDGHDPSVFKYGKSDAIWKATGMMTVNNTKGNPTLQADLFGDWREELVLRSEDNMSLRIYTTTDETAFRNYSLMYDYQYRQAVYWQQTAYNQPPHVSYFLGNLEGITLPPPPVCSNGKVEISNSVTAAEADGKFLQMAQTSGASVYVTGTVAPSNVMVNSPAEYSIEGGIFSGDMRLIKMGEGKLNLYAGADYSGNTEIWGGTFVSPCNFPNSHVILKRFAAMSVSGTFGKGIKMEYGSNLNPYGAYMGGSTTISCLDMDGGAIASFVFADACTTAVAAKMLTEDPINYADQLIVDTLIIGAANPIGATPVFEIKDYLENTLAEGDYTLVQAKVIMGDVSTIKVRGLVGKSYTLRQEGTNIVLHINGMRSATSTYWSGAVSSVWNLNDIANFLHGNEADVFVSGDAVTFDATASNKTVDVAETLAPASVTVEGDADYTFGGNGMVSGTASWVKNGTGTLYVNNSNDFTGGISINEGTVVVKALSDQQNVGALGAYTTETGKFYIGDAGTLKTTASVTNDCPITIGDGATIDVTGTFAQKAAITGTTLVKNGSGALTFGAYASLKKLVVNAGTVNLMDEYAGSTCLGDTVVLNGGTLQFADNSYNFCSSYSSWNVPGGATATARLDSRCNYRGSLVGAGNLTIYVPAYYRTYLYGDWSAFTGTLNATGAQSATYPIVFTNTYGLPNATLNIPNAADYVQLGDGNVSTSGTFAIGALTGIGYLAPGASTASAFNVGTLNTNFTFKGSSNATINKVGTGVMTMTANVGSGAVNVNEGSLQVNNSATATSSASGTGTLTVGDGATLYGRGYMGNTRVQVNAGGLFKPGYLYLGTLSLKGTLNVAEGGVLEFQINGNTANSSITVGNVCLFDGTVRILSRSDYVPALGDTFSFWTCKTFNKNHTPTVELPELPEGMKWDTSELLSTEGRVTIVADASGIRITSYDDEVEVSLISLNGIEAARFTCAYGAVSNYAAAADVVKGVYLIKIQNETGTTVKKFVKK